MIESVSDLVQLIVSGILFALSAMRAARVRDRGWILLTSYYGTSFFTNLYWAAYLLAFGYTPTFFITDLGWLASYIFLAMLLAECDALRRPCAPVPAAWAPVVAAVSFSAMYIALNGHPLTNATYSAAMAVLGFFAVRGMAASPAEGFSHNRAFHAAVLAYVAVELLLWTASCFWDTGGFYPYIVLNNCLTVAIAAMLACAWKSERL